MERASEVLGVFGVFGVHGKDSPWLQMISGQTQYCFFALFRFCVEFQEKELEVQDGYIEGVSEVLDVFEMFEAQGTEKPLHFYLALYRFFVEIGNHQRYCIDIEDELGIADHENIDIHIVDHIDIDLSEDIGVAFLLKSLELGTTLKSELILVATLQQFSVVTGQEGWLSATV